MTVPWERWFAAAVIRFGLAPDAFWSLTLAEWRALTKGGAGPEPMTRRDLDALITAHGDGEGRTG